ncbi:MAG TPA: efflux RND transporter permease subunit [Bacteroidia bacterium]|jgi:multidrug efflux pump subunit AcrB|nr:efflux RND transporter permease subunit [Bacteroidia bacterium]
MVDFALKRPITVIVIFLGILLFSVMAIFTIPVDIFPKLNSPTIYVIEPYGGMSPQQMEGFFATRLQDQFLYINGIKNIESKNIQGLTMLKLTFYESTDMAEVSAQVALQVSRAMNFFPPGAVPPQVIRFDASSLPVGDLVFSSKTRSLKDVYDLALTRIRPLFASVPGLSAPPPMGANARTLLMNIDPEKLRSYNITPDEVVQAVVKNNVITPSGNVRIGNTMYLVTNNSLEEKVKEFEGIPIVTNGTSTIFLSDVATVSDAADVTVGYALVNGKRSVYIPVVKTADASTMDVVNGLKSKLPEMRDLLPGDVNVSYEFDQSVFVINAVKSLVTEGALGALLTGLMVLLFLRDWRSSLIVIITIPVSVISAVMFLKLAGQTINLMTLSGLSLAIGVLVDQATVTIENIHQHLEMGKNKKLAIYDACKEISFPLLLILLCILAVFAPSFVMSGVPKAMFLPLSLSIGFAMIISFFAAQMLVPVLSNWILKIERYAYKHGQKHAHAGLAFDALEIGEVGSHFEAEKDHPEENDLFEKVKMGFLKRLEKLMPKRKLWVIAYFTATLIAVGVCFSFIGKDMLPKVNSGQFQLRIREPDGTRLERTEEAVHKVLAIIDSTVNNHVAISSAYVGLIPSSFGTSNLYVFNSGTQEAVIQVGLDEDYKTNLDELKEKLRNNIHNSLPDVRISFEPIELTEKIMSGGASTPIEIRVAGKNMDDIENYSGKLLQKLKAIPYLRDVQVQQPLKFPVIRINLDRLKIAQMGLSLPDVAQSVTDATSSSRFTYKNLWLDENNSYTYQTQIEVPEYMMNDMSQVQSIPLIKGMNRPFLGDVATFSIDSVPGEYDRSGPRRFVTVSANINKKDLGSATDAVQRSIAEIGELPKGLQMQVKGMSSLLLETFSSLQTGLLTALIVILLLLAANYQSFKLSLIVLSTTPAVLLGALLFLLATGSTLNLQSYMGIIMAIGVSVANSILIVTNAENLRPKYKSAIEAAKVSASVRLRPILMTSLAMIAGMIPMAAGFGEAGDQTAPLGRAVIGGLAASTLAALFIVPLVYSVTQQKASFDDPSLLPEKQ